MQAKATRARTVMHLIEVHHNRTGFWVKICKPVPNSRRSVRYQFPIKMADHGQETVLEPELTDYTEVSRLYNYFSKLYPQRRVYLKTVDVMDLGGNTLWIPEASLRDRPFGAATYAKDIVLAWIKELCRDMASS